MADYGSVDMAMLWEMLDSRFTGYVGLVQVLPDCGTLM